MLSNDERRLIILENDNEELRADLSSYILTVQIRDEEIKKLTLENNKLKSKLAKIKRQLRKLVFE